MSRVAQARSLRGREAGEALALAPARLGTMQQTEQSLIQAHAPTPALAFNTQQTLPPHRPGNIWPESHLPPRLTFAGEGYIQHAQDCLSNSTMAHARATRFRR